MAESQYNNEEFLDVLTESGEKTGISKSRKLVHRDGDFHRAVHVWFYAGRTGELLLQRRASRDSWPEQWDISSAGHVSAGDSSLVTARREVEEELGLKLPNYAFELLFVCVQQRIVSSRSFMNNEYDDIYLVTTLDRIPFEAFTLEERAITAVKYMNCFEYKRALETGDEEYLRKDINGPYGQLFTIIEERYKENTESRSSNLQKQIQRYAPISLAELSEISVGGRNALIYILKASMVTDEGYVL
ncbi:hypothetical protein LUZ60_000801 [Juncus effusus]|nr:hypothetical protein LUZ60_000801 [Juncus effusus]